MATDNDYGLNPEEYEQFEREWNEWAASLTDDEWYDYIEDGHRDYFDELTSDLI